MAMYIGQLAERTQCTRKAIRHYEALGLLPIPVRQGKYRVYTEMDVHVVLMIRRAQAVGFSLKELKELAEIKASQGYFPLAIANDLIRNKQRQLQQQIQHLEQTQQQLHQLQHEINQLYASEQAA